MRIFCHTMLGALHFLIVFPFLFSCGTPEPQKNIIATVGDAKLSLNEVVSDIPPQIRPNMTSLEIRQAVLRWVNSQALYQEAMERKLHEAGNLNRELEKLRIELLINALIEEALDGQVVVADEEVRDYYENNQEEFVLTEDRVHAYHIRVNSRKDANTVRSRLRSGDPFDEIVSSFDSDTSNLEWDLGYFSADQIIPEIAKVVFTLRKGRYSQPIKSSYGYHVVKVIDKKNKGDISSLDMAKDEIRMKLMEQKKQQNYQLFLRQVKNKFTITTNFKLLDSVVLDSLIRVGDGGVSN
ncbi:peptidyl-prolyl cis-trans isomerase [bacterium]|nr:peptidyl-prolyl cis-trans isomerase [bacterium]